MYNMHLSSLGKKTRFPKWGNGKTECYEHQNTRIHGDTRSMIKGIFASYECLTDGRGNGGMEEIA